MHRSFLALALVVSAALAACSGDDGAISVTPSQSTLTDKGNDSLFTVKLDDGRSDGYEMSVLTMKVSPDGKGPFTVSCSLVDTNGNGKLDKNETLTCVEGADNVLGADLVGKSIPVELDAKIDNEDKKVGETTWTPK